MYGYLKGNGHAHYGPGTAMTQFLPSGMAGCESVESLQSCCDSCSHGGSCGRGLISTGFGCACEKKGMGLFESGTDFSQWGIPEWSIVVLGGYMVMSTVFTTGRAVRRVKALPGEHRKRKAARLRARANELTKKK